MDMSSICTSNTDFCGKIVILIQNRCKNAVLSPFVCGLSRTKGEIDRLHITLHE